jgi:choline dehydrogenase-like flavoprotein
MIDTTPSQDPQHETADVLEWVCETLLGPPLAGAADGVELAPNARDAARERVADTLSQAQRAALGAALEQARFAACGQRERERVLARLLRAAGAAGVAARAAKRACMLEVYGGARARSDAVLLRAIGYPPAPRAPRARAAVETASRTPPPASVDVCVVGAGCGGSVAAHDLARAGHRVCVVEQGDVYDPAHGPWDELTAYRELFRGGGPAESAEGQVTYMAGSCVGGGSVVNWATCLDPPLRVRREWQERHGLEGLAQAPFDEDLASVNAALGVTSRCSELNGPNRLLRDGAAALGYSLHELSRNVDPALHDPALAGYTGFGDATGAKNTAEKTFLAPARAHGATVHARWAATALVRERGGWRVRLRRTGDEAPATASVTARHVVVAAGSLDSPSLLARSRLGGRALGRFLRLHPAPFAIGLYDEPSGWWWGPPQSVVCDHFADLGDGGGFIVESAQLRPGLLAAGLPWRGARQHRRDMASIGHAAVFVALVRDEGHGSVLARGDAQAIVRYPLDCPVDRRTIRRALVELVRLHRAAGARAIVTGRADGLRWSRGEAFASFERRLGAPGTTRAVALNSLHQMGSCRLGEDPGTSVAGTAGQLHGARGVWIADASAFPTAVGVNPMITTMALARRTARAVAAAS